MRTTQKLWVDYLTTPVVSALKAELHWLNYENDAALFMAWPHCDCIATGDGRSLQLTQQRLTTERTEILELMNELKLFGANTACGGTLAAALERNQERQRNGRLRVQRQQF